MSGLSRDAFQDTVREYRGLHDDSDVETRKAQYTTLVNQYYDLATDFYEFGWGQHFHFAPRFKHEKFLDSLHRHERFLARKLRLYPGQEVLDVGCGVGGPARYIAKHTGASITGVNNNAYQIERGQRHTRRAKLAHLVRFQKADFMELPYEDDHFDAIYTIEASCHAPDRVKLFEELRRVMKPGAVFGGYEWCLTDRYDADNPAHQKIKKDIEVGNGLPDLSHTSVIDRSLEKAGFELIETKDLAPTGDPQTPWYLALTGGDLSLSSIPRTPIGREITNAVTVILEKLRLAPKGTKQVSDFLNEGADALVAGGETGTFTPMYFFLVRNPG
ncbi:MAG: methyltransferase domain-containing protein [Myxococcota bacterium]